MSSSNPLTLWIQEFQRHQPQADAAQAWDHLLNVAPAFGQLPWVKVVDTNREAIAYVRKPGSPPVLVAKLSFARQYQRSLRRQKN